jgi:hypothetical protein
MAAEATIYPAVLVNELSISPSTYGIMQCEQPSAVFSPDYDQRTALFKLRLSIVQVCKAWYWFAISTLWSHVRLRCSTTPGVGARLFTTIVNNGALAQYVRRLTIEPIPSLPYFQRRDPIPFTKILPLFRNLRILTYPENLDIPLEDQLICHDMLAITRSSDSTPIPKLLGAHCPLFNHVHTISINCPSMYTFSSDSSFGENSVLFPRLVNLVLVDSSPNFIRAITHSWDIPRLRNISITYPTGPELSFRAMRGMLLKHRLVLQRVELCSIAVGLRTPYLDMPELQELALMCPGEEAVTLWLEDIRAPALQQLTICFNSPVEEVHRSDMFASEITEAIEQLPALKRIILVSDEKPLYLFTEYRHNKGNGMRDVIEWCRKGLTVEVRSNDESLRRVYTLATLPPHPEEGFQEYDDDEEEEEELSGSET